jgi:hypothetical protein
MTLVERVALMKNQKERDLKEAERKKVPSPPNLNLATSHSSTSNTNSHTSSNANNHSHQNANSHTNTAHVNTQSQRKPGGRLAIGLLTSHPPVNGTNPSGSNSARESREPDAECERVKAERSRGRYKSAGSFQNFPGAGAGVGIGMGIGARSDDSPMISFSPTVQSLLHPPSHIEAVPFSVPIRRDQSNFSPKSRWVNHIRHI